MKHQSKIVLNRIDLQKIAVEYVKSLGYVTNREVNIVHDPKANYDDRFRLEISIQAEPTKCHSN